MNIMLLRAPKLISWIWIKPIEFLRWSQMLISLCTLSRFLFVEVTDSVCWYYPGDYLLTCHLLCYCFSYLPMLFHSFSEKLNFLSYFYWQMCPLCLATLIHGKFVCIHKQVHGFHLKLPQGLPFCIYYLGPFPNFFVKRLNDLVFHNRLPWVGFTANFLFWQRLFNQEIAGGTFNLLTDWQKILKGYLRV